MARRSGFSRGRPSSSGVSRQWNAGTGGTAVTTVSGTSQGFLGSAVQPTADELTVMRTRGLLDLFVSGAPSSDGDGFFGAVGIGVTSAAAVATGIGSVPTPLRDVGWMGWLWHSFVSVHWQDVSQAVGNAAHLRIEMDSKAMRKFGPDSALYCAFDLVEIGTASVDVFFDSRILVQDSGR